jgi:hypothetical protein
VIGDLSEELSLEHVAADPFTAVATAIVWSGMVA